MTMASGCRWINFSHLRGAKILINPLSTFNHELEKILCAWNKRGWRSWLSDIVGWTCWGRCLSWWEQHNSHNKSSTRETFRPSSNGSIVAARSNINSFNLYCNSALGTISLTHRPALPTRLLHFGLLQAIFSYWSFIQFHFQLGKWFSAKCFSLKARAHKKAI